MSISTNAAELLVELSRLNANCAASYQSFMRSRNELVTTLESIDNQFITLADQFRGNDWGTVEPELHNVLGDLCPRLDNGDLERQLANLADCFARKIKYVAHVCLHNTA